MRVLIVSPGPNFSVEDVCRGWAGGMERCGVDTRLFDLGARLTYHESALGKLQPDITALQKAEDAVRLASESLLATCLSFAPHVVVVVSCFFVPPFVFDILKARGMKVVSLLTESPYEDESQLAIAARADLAILNDPTNLEMFRQHQPNTWYLPHAYDPAVHRRRAPSPDLCCDFGWVGTAYKSRIEFFESVDWPSNDLLFAGNWKNYTGKLTPYLVHDTEVCFDNDATVDLYSSCIASVNLYRREAARPDLVEGWSMGPREVELAAVGTFFLTEERGENREVLPMIPTFTSPGDFSEQLGWWLDHDDQRSTVEQAMSAAIEPHTFDARCRFLLDKLS